jgi:tRNA U34 2-thiouridine synthase MnmA/TrmU
MPTLGASFVVSGEVLGQRPMSQKLDTMRLIEKETGLEGLILRPLSAKILAPTKAEKEGWIKREDLLAIAGRGRKEQIALAKQLGVNDYPCPSGGCLLTDPSFSRRVKDLLKYADLNLKEAQLLKLGRHFRINPELKLIVGRNEKENTSLLALAEENDIYLEPKDLAGPTALFRGILGASDKALASQIVAYYTTKDNEIEVIIKTLGRQDSEIISTSALAEEKLRELLI